jgi:PAS domain S-box-containing protein
MGKKDISLRNLPIRFKMFGIYALVFTIAMVCGGLIIYFEVSRIISDNIENELTTATNTILNSVQTAAQASIKNYLRAVAEKNRDIVSSLYAEYQAGRMTETEAKDRARKVLFSQAIGDTGYIYCLDSKGTAVEHPLPLVAGVNFSEFEFIGEQVRRKEGYLEYEWKNPGDIKPRSKALYMIYFKPWDWIISVSSYRDEFRQLINISDFRERILAFQFGKTGYCYVIDSSGNVVVHPVLSGNLYNTQDADGQYMIRRQCETKSGKLVYKWKNPGEGRYRDKIVIYNYIPEYDWIVGASGYLEEFYTPLNSIRMTVFSTLVVVLAIVLITTLWIAGGITRPLRQLEKQLAAGEDGNFTGRMVINNRDEIGNLAVYFNDFMDRLERYSVAIGSEIVERRKTAEALQKSEEKYRTILESIEEGYFELTMEGQFTFFNEAMTRITGYRRESLTTLHYDQITAPVDSGRIRMAFEQVKKTGHAMRASEWTLKRWDGSLCHAETSLSVVRGGEGEIIGVRGVLRDLTENRVAQEALRLSEEMFSKAFGSSPSGMFITRLSDHRVINANMSFLKMIGRTHREVVGKDLMEHRIFSSDEDHHRLVHELETFGRVRNMELSLMTSQGEERTAVASAETVRIWGEACMLCAVEDLTETQRLEREIIDISEAERQRVGHYLHDDLCSHLLGIEVLHKVLRQKLSKIEYPEIASVDRIRDLIREAISKTRRISRGLCPVNIADNGLVLILQELCGDIREIYGVSCRFDHDQNVVMEDPSIATHIYYIAREAAYNAVKHGKADTIFLSLTGNGALAQLQIRDNGHGIPKSLKLTGMGIRIMHYRARRIGADLQAERIGDSGSLVSLSFHTAAKER